MAQNYDFATSGWPAAAPATGGEQVFGLDAGGNLAAMPLSALQARGLFNWDPALLQKWRRAKARVVGGAARAIIECHGDSTTAGSNGTSMGPRAKAYPARLAAALTARGIPAGQASWIGDGGTQAYGYSLASYDPTLTLSGTATFTQYVLAALGGAAVCLQANGDAITWSPIGVFDTIDIYYVKYSGGSTFTTAVNGGSASANVNANASAASVAKISVALGSVLTNPTLKLTDTGVQNYILGMVAYNSTSRTVDVLNGGRCGWKSTDLTSTTNAWSPLNEAVAIAPDLVIYDGMINDYVASAVPVATTQANISKLVTTMQAAGADVILKVPFPSQLTGNAYGSATTMFQYRAMLYGLAQSLNVPLIDLFYRFGGPAGQADPWTPANANGYAGDSLHPTALGYEDESQWIASLLAAA